jgi:hypothetical protein
MSYSPAPGSAEYDRFVAYERAAGSTLAEEASVTDDDDARRALVAHDAQVLVATYQRAAPEVREALMTALHVGSLLSVTDAADVEARMLEAVASMSPRTQPPGLAA